MKFGTRLAVCSAAVLLTAAFPACTSLEIQNNPESSQKQPKNIVGGELLEAFIRNDAEAFLNQYPDGLRKNFSKTGFEQSRNAIVEKLGKPVSCRFVANLEHPVFTVSVWTIRFERDNADKSGKTGQEIVFRAIAGELDGKNILMNQNFFLDDAADLNAAQLRLSKKNPPEQPPKRVGKELLDALADNNAKVFLNQLPPRMRQEFGKKDFEQTRESMLKELGKPVSYQFVMNLEHPVFTVSLWKIRFERRSADRTKKIYQEKMFRVVKGEVNGKEVLLNFHFL